MTGITEDGSADISSIPRNHVFQELEKQEKEAGLDNRGRTGRNGMPQAACSVSMLSDM